MKQFIQPGPVPYLTLDEIKSMTKEQIEARFGEATFDEIVQLTVIREKIVQDSGFLSVVNDIAVTRKLDRLNSQIFAPGRDAIRAKYPLPPESISMVERSEPVTYKHIEVDLQMAEVRYFISDDAILRGASDWLEADSARLAAEHLAHIRDKHVLESWVNAAPAGNAVTATAKWTSDSATPEKDLSTAIGNILKNSNISTDQINKPQAFALILPAEAFPGITKLKLIRNITQPVRDFLETEYKVKIVFTKKPEEESSWPITGDALVVPIQDRTIGFLGTFDGGGVVPSQEKERVGGRGVDVILRQWFKWTTIPHPFSGTTISKIAKITGVA